MRNKTFNYIVFYAVILLAANFHVVKTSDPNNDDISQYFDLESFVTDSANPQYFDNTQNTDFANSQYFDNTQNTDFANSQYSNSQNTGFEDIGKDVVVNSQTTATVVNSQTTATVVHSQATDSANSQNTDKGKAVVANVAVNGGEDANVAVNGGEDANVAVNSGEAIWQGCDTETKVTNNKYQLNVILALAHLIEAHKGPYMEISEQQIKDPLKEHGEWVHWVDDKESPKIYALMRIHSGSSDQRPRVTGFALCDYLSTPKKCGECLEILGNIFIDCLVINHGSAAYHIYKDCIMELRAYPQDFDDYNKDAF